MLQYSRCLRNRVSNTIPYRVSRHFRPPVQTAKRNLVRLSTGVRVESFLSHPKTYSTAAPGENSPQELKALERLEAVDAVMQATAPTEDVQRLRACYAIIFEVFTYLERQPDNSEAADATEAYLSIFMNSEVPEGSDIGRARKSVFRLTRLIASLLSAVSTSSPLRAAHPQIFDLLGALEPAFMVYSGEADTREWMQFWDRIQPIVLELASKLDEAGFGAD